MANLDPSRNQGWERNALREEGSLQGDTAGTTGIDANNYFEGWVSQERYRLELHQAGYFPTV